MWLRSQNKEMLINANNIRIISDSHSYDIICDFYDGEYYYLGEYSTKEKALKVMDMIQNAITGTRFEFTDIVRDCDLAGIEIHNVFNMPQDSEVKA